MRKVSVPWLLVLSFAVAMAAAEAAGSSTPSSRPITNKVLDLLNGDVLLQGGSQPTVWESAPFDTSQFSWIGIRTRTGDDSDAVACQPAWQLSPGDPFEVERSLSIDINRGLGGEFGVVTQSLFNPFSSPSVQGLRAKILCRVLSSTRLGDDVTPSEPTAATLTDVKVLLRHW